MNTEKIIFAIPDLVDACHADQSYVMLDRKIKEESQVKIGAFFRDEKIEYAYRCPDFTGQSNPKGGIGAVIMAWMNQEQFTLFRLAFGEFRIFENT